MEAHELIHAALEWAKSNGYAQRAQEEQVPLKDAYAEVRRLREETGKPLDAAQSRIEELERERNGILSLNDELANERNALKWQIDEASKGRAELQARVEELEQELNAVKTMYKEDVKGYEQDRITFEHKIVNLDDECNDLLNQRNALQRDLDAAKDARIEAECEAADLRAWRKGLVKPGTVEPKKGNHVVVLNEAGDIYLERIFPLPTSARYWFDPCEIFAAADRDAEQADQDSADECD